MKIETTPLRDVLIIRPNLFSDKRGYFYESFQQSRYEKLGLPLFIQDNVSFSKKNTLRGLHYQLPYTQGKLVWVSRGAVFDVVVDLRLSSPTFGQWYSILLTDTDHTQIYVPPGLAHGFCVLSEKADFYYKCTDYYMPEAERGIIWNDAGLNIDWPIKNPILSPKDQTFLSLRDIPHEKLFP